MTDDQPDQANVVRKAISRPLEISAFRWPSSAARLDLAAVSSCGNVQLRNTDHYLVIRLGRLQETLVTSLAAADLPSRFEEYAYAMCVADGLDEGGGGVRASRVALSALAHLGIRYGKWNVRVEPDSAIDIVDQGEFLYRRVNDAVRDASQADGRLGELNTSLTAVYIAGDDLFFAQVGHSRAFLFRDGTLTQLTVDDTLEQLRLQSMTPASLEGSKRDQEHIVTETIGGRAGGPDIVIEHVQLWDGDRVMLCTNGLTDLIGADQIADVLASHRRPAEECQRLVDLALAAGAPDNVTVLLADYWIPADPTATKK
jgi:protein phosphatase